MLAEDDEPGVELDVRLTIGDASGPVEWAPPGRDALGAPLPDWLERIVAPILADFQVPEPIELITGFSVEPGGRRWLWVQEPGDMGPCGVEIRDGVGDHGWLTVELADRLQEQFFLETAQAWGQPRPPCPGHPHPLVAAMHDGEPRWLCPRTGAPVAPIGGLGSSFE